MAVGECLVVQAGASCGHRHRSRGILDRHGVSIDYTRAVAAYTSPGRHLRRRLHRALAAASALLRCPALGLHSRLHPVRPDRRGDMVALSAENGPGSSTVTALFINLLLLLPASDHASCYRYYFSKVNLIFICGVDTGLPSTKRGA